MIILETPDAILSNGKLLKASDICVDLHLYFLPDHQLKVKFLVKQLCIMSLLQHLIFWSTAVLGLNSCCKGDRLKQRKSTLTLFWAKHTGL